MPKPQNLNYTIMKTEAEKLVNEALEASRLAQQNAIAILTVQGETIELSDWVTIKEYTRLFGLESTNVVSNWIKRGIIPPENIRIIKEFNDIRLIKAVPYMETA